MFHRSKTIKDLLNIVPGKRRLGAYRFLPIFFCIGGIMEWIMINVRIGQETFYDVYRRKQSEREYQQKIADGLIVLNQSPAKWKMMIGLNEDLTRHLKTLWDTHAIMNAAKETSEKLMVQWLPTCRFYYLYSLHLQHCSIKQQGRRISFRKMKIILTKALFACENHIEISSL